MVVRRIRWGRIGVVSLLGGTGLLGLGAILPLPRGLDGATFCYPLIGPVQRFDPRLTGAAGAIVRAHEAVHATQCHRLGFMRRVARQLTTQGRLGLEAEAYCAQGQYEVSTGASAYPVYQRLVDELRYTGRWFAGLSEDTIRAALAGACPSLARAASNDRATPKTR